MQKKIYSNFTKYNKRLKNVDKKIIIDKKIIDKRIYYLIILCINCIGMFEGFILILILVFNGQ